MTKKRTRKANRRQARTNKQSMTDRFFVFELLDSQPYSKECLAKLSYRSVFDVMRVLIDYCPETHLFVEMNEMLEYVAVSPQSILFDEESDIVDLYYSIEEYTYSLCQGFFSSEENMLDLIVDSKRLANRKTMISDYRDTAHALAQLLFIFGKAKKDKKTVLVYGDFMNDKLLSGV